MSIIAYFKGLLSLSCAYFKTLRGFYIAESQKNWRQKYQLSFRDYSLFLFYSIAQLYFAPIFDL